MHNYGLDANKYATLQKCQGDCDEDSHCATGLKCFQREKGEKVPGCLAGGDGDISDTDYCYEDPGAQCDGDLPHRILLC